jgi:glycosyltransferase involved in cell wall biosynthesis
MALLLRRRAGIRILFLCHNVIPHEGHWGDRWLTKLALRRGDAFIVHSEKDLVDLKELLPEAWITKTPHPAYDIFSEGRLETEIAKKELGFACPVVLFFGFVRKYKGLMYLLRAMPKVLDRLEAHLLVVGEFWDDKRQYLRLVEELGIGAHVTIIDEYVANEQVGRYFSAADVVALPYTDVTGSGVVQVAFGFHRPVITTDVGSMAEVVEHGETGLLVPSHDSDALAEAIAKYFEQSLVDGFARNIQRQTKGGRYSWDKLVAVIEEMASQRHCVGATQSASASTPHHSLPQV